MHEFFIVIRRASNINVWSLMFSLVFKRPRPIARTPNCRDGSVLLKSLSMIGSSLVGSVLLLAALVVAGPVFAQSGSHEIQSVSDFKRTHSLNSSAEEKHTWWARLGELNPAAESARLRAALLAAGGKSDVPGKPWYAVKLPGYLDGMPGYDYDVKRAWYLKTLTLSGKDAPPLALRLGQINDRDRVYLNGELVGGTGRFGAEHAQAFDRERLYELPTRLLRPGLNIVLVHVEVYSPGYLGLVKGNLSLGSTLNQQRAIIGGDLMDVLFMAAYLMVGAYFLFLFIRRGRERENMFFGLFLICFVIYMALRTQFRFDWGFSFIVIKKTEYVFLYGLFPLFYYFFRTYYDIPRTGFWKWWDRIMVLPVGINVLGVIIALTTWNAELLWQYQGGFLGIGIAQPFWFIFVIGIFTILINRVRAGERDAYYMLPAWILTWLVFILDVFSNRGTLNLPPFLMYFFFVFIVSMATILANRFVRLNQQVEDLNQNLELKVKERTERLNQSLSEVQALKVQQDGDYFLTSLLINPLGGNYARPGRVLTEVRTNQKKQFQFRHWNAEIVGDLSAVYDIKLRERDYTVFVNGDAMGKSIQGAGGALVLGTVFKSVVTRSQLTAAARSKFPEQWLRECFFELQSVFVSFDGFMLITAILGLIDNETGTMYYINSGHPSLVRYRNGQAELMGDDFNLNKIGIAGVDDDLRITILRMEPGDVVLSGSDGRDDLLLGLDENGNRIINEDEYLFVRAVEEGKGELEDVSAALFARGEQTDDFSLLRFGYLEDAPALVDEKDDEYSELLNRAEDAWKAGGEDEAVRLLEEAVVMRPREPAPRLSLAKLHRRRKDYARAAQNYIAYQEMRPDDTDALFDIALMLKMNGERTAAIDFGERCRMREPGHVKNLVNLADCYRLTENEERAALLLGKARALEPDNESVRRLDDLMKA